MLVLFALVATRVAGLFIGSPLLSRRDVPARYRVALALLLSAALLPSVPATALPVDAVRVLGALAAELLLGLALGLCTRLVLVSFQLAGAVTSTQMGFALGSTFSPEAEDMLPELAALQLSFATLLFLLFDGHHFLLRSVAASFEVFPPGGPLATGGLAELVSASFGSMFELGARVAAPISGLLLLVNALIGFLNRVSPQLSIFNVGFPMTVAAGLLGTLASLPSLAAFVLSAKDELEHSLAGLLGH